MLLRPANWNRRFLSAVAQPAQAYEHGVASSFTTKWDVSSNLNVTDLRFCWVVSRVGSNGLSLRRPGIVASKVARSFMLELGSNGSIDAPSGTTIRSSVLSSSVYCVKPEAVSLSLPPLSSWLFP